MFDEGGDSAALVVLTEKENKMAKTSEFSPEEKMTVDMFLRRCFQCASKSRKENKGVFYLYGITFVGHLYLSQYRIDLFNCFFPLVIIDTNTNIIKIWARYGVKKKVKDEYKYDFSVVDPTYIIEGLLCNEDEVVCKDPEDMLKNNDDEKESVLNLSPDNES